MFCLSAYRGREKVGKSTGANYKYMCEEYREHIKAKKAKINSASPEIDLKTHSRSRVVTRTA